MLVILLVQSTVFLYSLMRHSSSTQYSTEAKILSSTATTDSSTRFAFVDQSGDSIEMHYQKGW